MTGRQCSSLSEQRVTIEESVLKKTSCCLGQVGPWSKAGSTLVDCGATAVLLLVDCALMVGKEGTAAVGPPLNAECYPTRRSTLCPGMFSTGFSGNSNTHLEGTVVLRPSSVWLLHVSNSVCYRTSAMPPCD